METWIDIPGYENFYKISNIGNVKSLNRKIFYYGGLHPVKERILKKCIDPVGYYSVRLKRIGIGRTYRICQLVAMSFLGPRPVNYEINHKNGQKQDDRITNLEYVTHKENMAHASIHNLIKKGDTRKTAKLKESEVRKILIMYQNNTQEFLAKKFGISRIQIYRIVNGLSWKHIS